MCKENEVGYDKVTLTNNVEAIESRNELDCSKEEKNILQITKLNEQTYMELILLIDQKTASGKVKFGVVQNCKMRKYLEGTARWHGIEWLQNMLKNDPILPEGKKGI